MVGKVQVPKSPKGEASVEVVAGGGPKGEANPPRVPMKIARPEGIEPPALGFEGRCSIQLSYGRSKGEIIPAPAGPVKVAFPAWWRALEMARLLSLASAPSSWGCRSCAVP